MWTCERVLAARMHVETPTGGKRSPSSGERKQREFLLWLRAGWQSETLEPTKGLTILLIIEHSRAAHNQYTKNDVIYTWSVMQQKNENIVGLRSMLRLSLRATEVVSQLSKARSSVSPHEWQHAKLSMAAMPRGAHLDCTLYVLYVFGLTSLFQRSVPVQNLYACGVSDNAPGGCLTPFAVAKPCAPLENNMIFLSTKRHFVASASY